MSYCWPHPVTRAARTAQESRRVTRNLVILVFLGVAASGWILCYTSWFPIVTGLLGLGGLLAWVAFLGGLLTDERKQDLQRRFEKAFLARQATFWWALGLAFAFLLLASQVGTIEIKTIETRGYSIEVEPAAQRPPPVGLVTESAGSAAEQRYLESPGSLREPYWVWWFRGRDYWVKPIGLPALRVPLNGFTRVTLTIPDSFERRPIVLVRPSGKMTLSIENEQRIGQARHDLIVWKRANAAAPVEIGRIARDRYTGETVWVGCDSRVSIPQATADRLRLEVEPPETRDDVMALWLAPLALATRMELTEDDVVAAALCVSSNEDGSFGIWAFGQVRVQTPRPGDEFVQLLRLRELVDSETVPVGYC